MQHDPQHSVTGQLVDEHSTLTLAELCRSCGVHVEWVTLLVEEGVLEPRRDHTRGVHWRFPARELPRVHVAARLQRDLGLNVSGVALALELIDEIRSLRERVDALEQRTPQR